jgi:hypothetical protein
MPKVAACQVPRHGDAPAQQVVEDDLVALLQLVGGEPAAERVVHVRVRPSLVEHQVAALEAVERAGQVHQEAPGVLLAVVGPCRAEVHHLRMQVQLLDDVVRAVAPVLVQVQDADAPGQPACEEGHDGHHQPVKGAETAGVAVARVMKPRAGRHGADAVLERPLRRGKHGAARVAQAGGDGG